MKYYIDIAPCTEWETDETDTLQEKRYNIYILYEKSTEPNAQDKPIAQSRNRREIEELAEQLENQ